MSELERRQNDELVRSTPERKVRRPRGVQPSFAERQETWRERGVDWDILIPDNDAHCYSPDKG